MEKNLDTLGKAKFRSIITSDPHTFNTLKNEYGLDGLSGIDIRHHTEIIWDLIDNGKLRLNKTIAYTATYHDPCYLGRYNGIYSVPRKIIKSLGIRLKEMPRNRASSYCCGGGGGRIWMDDKVPVKERPSESRIREAVALNGVETLIVACPKDIVMFISALKTTGNEDKINIREISELVWLSAADMLEE